MTKYKVGFVHTVEETYVAIVEANSKKEALEILEEGPFQYLEDEEPIDVQSLNIEFGDVEKLED